MARTNTNTGGGGGGSGTVTNIATGGSLFGGPITTTGTLSLVNDNVSPGNNFFYGTNGAGAKAWISQSAVVFPINSLADATGNGVVDLGNNALTWRWNTLTSANGISLTSTSTASTGTNQNILNINMTGAHAASNVETTGLEVNNQHTGTGSKNVGIVAIAGNGGDNYSILANNKVAIGYAGAPSAALSDLLTVGANGVQGSIGIVNGTFNKIISVGVSTNNFTNWSLTLPDTAGNSGEFLTTNGSGVTSWAAPTVAAPGSDTEIVYNQSGSLAASASFQWDYAASRLNITGNDANSCVAIDNDAAVQISGIGNSTAGWYMSAGGNGNGEVGLYNGANDAIIATGTMDNLGSGDEVYFFGGGKIASNLTQGFTYLGEWVAGQVYVRTSLTNQGIDFGGQYNSVPNSILGFIDTLNGSVVFGDISASSNGSFMEINDVTATFRTVNVTRNNLGGAIALPGMQVESSGGSVTITDNARGLYYDPGTVQSTETITLPASPTDGDEVVVLFGGTITSGNVLTTATIAPNTGQVLLGTFSADYDAGGGFTVKFREANGTWYKVEDHAS